MRPLLNAAIFGAWLWLVVMGTATVLLAQSEVPRPAQQAHGGVAARTPAPRPSEHRQPAVTLDVARSDGSRHRERPSASRPATLRGTASWYRQPGLVAAAGPALRTWPHWRGSFVRVCADQCIVVRIVDWCACPRRLIDLSDGAFSELAPLPVGLVRVTIRPITLPATDR